MPQNAFFPRTRDLLVSQKMIQSNLFPTLHPLSTVNFATAIVLAFVLLRDSRFNVNCYTQREATPTRKSAQKCAATSCDFLCERLQSAFTRANQLRWIAQYTNMAHAHHRILKQHYQNFTEITQHSIFLLVIVKRIYKNNTAFEYSNPQYPFGDCSKSIFSTIAEIINAHVCGQDRVQQFLAQVLYTHQCTVRCCFHANVQKAYNSVCCCQTDINSMTVQSHKALN